MVDTATRLLQLLTLLQTRTGWTGAALAETLGVSSRTVRNDVDRLRSLGYPIHGTRGEAGGYHLGAGTALPPLMLADDEAIAVALGLHLATTHPVAGLDAAAGTALTKLQQVLPARLRHQLATLEAALPAAPETGAADGPPGAGATVSPASMLAIASAIAERHVLRFDYQRHDGRPSRREAEPIQLVFAHRRWYLVAWDRDRADWRTFRVDRMQPRVPPGPRFPPREPPPGGVVAFVTRGIHAGVMQFRATLRVFAPATEIAPLMPPAVVVTPEGAASCRVAAGASTPAELATVLARLDAEYEVIDSPELVSALRDIAGRYTRAIARSAPGLDQGATGAPTAP